MFLWNGWWDSPFRGIVLKRKFYTHELIVKRIQTYVYTYDEHIYTYGLISKQGVVLMTNIYLPFHRGIQKRVS
jgi:HD-like signal output (HDOD) protein